MNDPFKFMMKRKAAKNIAKKNPSMIMQMKIKD